MEVLVESQLSKEEERKSEKGIAGKGRRRKREKSKKERRREGIFYIV